MSTQNGLFVKSIEYIDIGSILHFLSLRYGAGELVTTHHPPPHWTAPHTPAPSSRTLSGCPSAAGPPRCWPGSWGWDRWARTGCWSGWRSRRRTGSTSPWGCPGRWSRLGRCWGGTSWWWTWPREACWDTPHWISGWDRRFRPQRGYLLSQ